MFQRTDVREGMIVRSIDGEKLGKVFAIGDGEFHIEKGLFFPKDYLVRYSEISDIRGGEIVLTHGRDSLRSLSGDEKYGTMGTGTTAGLGGGAGVGPGAVGMPAERASTGYAADTSLGMGSSTAGLGASGLGATSANLGTERTVTGRNEEIAIPVHKEELDILKREKQAGEVRVHKEVVAEERVVDVPVRRERVRVERRDVNPDRPAMSASFQEETVIVPLRAEEVEVQKRAVVDEEVIIHKDSIEEERRVAATVRHEDVDIRTDGDVEGGRTLNAPTDDDPLKRRY